MKISHRERLLACIANDSAIDRPPVSLWRHFPVDDQHPETLADATLAFQSQFDFDFVKVTPASSFCLKDWGADDLWEGASEGTRRYINHPINSPDAWEQLTALDPYIAKYLSKQLDCLRLIRARTPKETSILQTVFSPLAQAKNLVGGKKLITDLRRFPEAVSSGLTKIAETTRRFVEAAIDTGIDGIFYAIQHAQPKELTYTEYVKYGVQNDLRSLEPAKGLFFNLIHLHGNQVYFNILPLYGSLFKIVNWHDQETPPSLTEALEQFNGAVCGGISQRNVIYNTKWQIQNEARDSLEKTKGSRHILGTGCVVPIIAPYGNIMAIRQSVEKIK